MTEALRKYLAHSVTECCELTGLGRSSIYKAIAAKQLKARKLGRRTLIEADELSRFIKALPASDGNGEVA